MMKAHVSLIPDLTMEYISITVTIYSASENASPNKKTNGLFGMASPSASVAVLCHTG
jgi:hypothetical protein